MVWKPYIKNTPASKKLNKCKLTKKAWSLCYTHCKNISNWITHLTLKMCVEVLPNFVIVNLWYKWFSRIWYWMIRTLQSGPFDFNVIATSNYNILQSNTRLEVYFMWFPILYPLPYYTKAFINKLIWMCVGFKEAICLEYSTCTVCFGKIILFYIDVSTSIRLGTPYLEPAHTLLLLYLDL